MLAKRMTIMLVITGIVLGLIFGYKAVGNYFMNQFFDNMPIPPVTITENTVEEQEWRRTLTAVGTVNAEKGAMVTAQTSGVLRGIHFENGQQVKQGDRLFSLDTEVAEAERYRLHTMLEQAEQELRRLTPLLSNNNVSKADVERAENQVNQARAALAAQDALIRQKTPRAPFDGVLGIRQVNLGEYITPGTGLVQLTSFDPIYVQFNVVEQRLSLLHSGMEIQVQVDAYPERTFTGHINAIAPNVDASTRTVEVQAVFRNEDHALRPGMFARVTLPLGEPRVVKVIPKTAIQFNPFGNLVFLIAEEGEGLKVTQRLIRTGDEQGDMIEVVQGLNVGDRVASSGLLKLRNGSTVLINSDPALQPSTDTQPTPNNG
ncbi:efflux transporter periplasmic adaptor subunit [Aliidiomarina taiwanensis]|uniref:Efflux transporter periplasmic adaptor subunit n=1 Tax=Aliidiomarina taiwanensis TaxID=946228 RepID=A0A432XAA3_9GAMM|nr:efflux RND transporter periplasmic adaptor subunit [Aliidiomarina taiwanensis]RUO44246.1 efflux transporter periplasmic adaptor subunit [Aliidiomarina taiwanensis]